MERVRINSDSVVRKRFCVRSPTQIPKRKFSEHQINELFKNEFCVYTIVSFAQKNDARRLFNRDQEKSSWYQTNGYITCTKHKTIIGWIYDIKNFAMISLLCFFAFFRFVCVKSLNLSWVSTYDFINYFSYYYDCVVESSCSLSRIYFCLNIYIL